MEQQKLESAQTVVGSRSADKKRNVTVGSVWSSKRYGQFEVLHYHGCEDVLVRFIETGFEAKTQSVHIRSGNVKDKFYPSIFGVGFVGDGDFNPYSNGEKSIAYDRWYNMITRCYSEKCHKLHPTYKGCTVCEEWHNFQNFAKWFYDNYPNDGNVYHLDKDLKEIGNRVYSPRTCTFVPPSVNSFANDNGSVRGKYLIGARKQGNLFISTCCNPLNGGVNEYIGHFKSDIEAHLAWRKRKSELAYELAMNQDREEVKLALLNWKRALDNFEIHKIKD